MQARQANRQAGREEGSRHRLGRWQTGRQTNRKGRWQTSRQIKTNRIGRWQTGRQTNKQNRLVADRQADKQTE